MPRKPFKARPDNFKLLDPDLAATKRLVEGMEAMLRPIPWHEPDGLTYQQTPMQDLAERIHARADRGLTVQLSPATARQVATALAVAPVTDWSVQRSYGYTVEDWTHQPAEVIARCRNLTLAVGAWTAYAPDVLNRRIVVRWGPFTARDSWRAAKGQR